MLKKTMRHCCYMLLACCACFPAAAFAAAQDHTVLYYLMEMQRQRGAPCPGSVKTPLPSLVPSTGLRNMAGQDVEGAKAAAGIKPGDAFFYTTVAGATPQAALQGLQASACPDLMSPAYTYVGARRQGNSWVVVLSETNPVYEGDPLLQQENTLADASAGRPGVSDAYGSPAGSPPPPAPAPAAWPPAPPEPPRPGITPLADEPPRTQQPLVYSAPGVSAGAGSATMGASAPLQDLQTPSSPGTAGNMPVQGRAAGVSGPAASSGGQMLLTDRSGKQVPVVIVGGGAGELADGGMLIDKNTEEGFVGEAPRNLMDPTRKPVAAGAALSGARSVDTPDSPAAVGAQKSMPKARAVLLGPEAQELFTLVNKVRQGGQMCGGSFYRAPALTLNAELTAVAQKHAADMAAQKYFSSTTPDGLGVGERISASGYRWSKASENIAMMEPPASQALHHWLQQAGQCAGIMSSDYQDVGIGFVPHDNLWTITLAAPQQVEDEAD